MKKRLLLFFIAGCAIFAANAQVDLRVDVGGNYTMYKGDFQESTPGGKLRVSAAFSERAAAGLAFTYGFPIRIPSQVAFTGSTVVPSELVYNFKTITLDCDYFFGGEKETGFTFYGTPGISLVLVNYKEKLKGSAPQGEEPIDMVESTNENGFTINLGAGTQYSFGRAKVFANAAVALPANKVNDDYVVNVIPAHFIFNLGVRFSLTSGSDYY